jgi:tetratricopeptide (TPR) repeat protein
MGPADPTHQDGAECRPRGRLPRVPGADVVAAFCIAAVVVPSYALRGGAYDIVVRQEFGVVVWWVLVVGLLTGALPRSTPSRLCAVPLAGLAALVGVTALGLTYTESAERTVDELARTLHYVGVVALILSAVDVRTWKPVLAGLAVGAVTVSVLALGSRLFPHLYPPDAVDRVFPGTRLQYPLSYWNGVAAFSVMAATLLLGVSASFESLVARALSLAAVPTLIAVSYLTYARGGVVAVVVGLAALIVLIPQRALLVLQSLIAAISSASVILVIRAHPEIARGDGTEGAVTVVLATVLASAACFAFAALMSAVGAGHRLRMRRDLARGLTSVCAVACVVLGSACGPGLVSTAVDELHGPAPSSLAQDPAARLTSLGSARYDIWAAALDIHRAEPVHGTGPGTFEFAWNRSPRYSEYVRDAHSLYLESLAEEGWFGFAAAIWALGGLLAVGIVVRVNARSNASDAGALGAALAMFVVLLVYAGFDWMWELTAVTVLGLVGACTVLGSVGRARARVLDWRIRVILALMAVVAGLTQLPGLVSTAKIRTSQAEVRAGNFDAARVDAEDAVASAPWAASPYVQRALLFERADRLRSAEADIRRAWELEPTNYRHPLLLARILALEGRVRPALTAFLSARRLAPRKRIVEGGPTSTG